MKRKLLVTLIVVALVIGCGAVAYGLQGIDTQKNSRIPANDSYSTLTIPSGGGTAVISREDLKAIGEGGSKGLHVTDGNVVFSLDQAFVASVAGKGEGATVNFKISYSADKASVGFLITDEGGKDCFGDAGRCMGEITYKPESGVDTNTLVVMQSDGMVSPMCGWYPDANLMRWQLPRAGEFKMAVKSVSFSDVKNHWGKKFIDYLSSRGVANGMGNGIFSPDTGLTRAQFVTFLASLSMEDCSDYTINKFKDVPSSAWFYKTVAWAYKAGITSGTSDTAFSPNNLITREQMARMAVCFIKYKQMGTTAIRSAAAFPDAASISSWALEDVKLCRAMGILNGDQNGNFNPKATATRAEACTVCAGIISYALIMPQ